MSFEFERWDLFDLVEISRGSFGTVNSANLPGHGNVTVKKVKTHTEAYREWNQLKGINHRNILKLIGIAKKGKTIPWLIFEYMPMGNLLDYVQSYAGDCPPFGLLKMAHGIATGMDFLHRQKWHFVHRDLAARNVLVGENWLAKIGDFGHCDSYIENENYYADENGRPWPIRWMPPENLPNTGRKFSRKGDVWSFGVVLFEIWSGGKRPYDGVNDEDIMGTIIEGNNPLDYTSVSAPNYITNMMKRCWQYKTKDRPNFRRLQLNLEENEPLLFGSPSSDSESSSDYSLEEQYSAITPFLPANDFSIFTREKKKKRNQNKSGERRQRKKGKGQRKIEYREKFDIME